MTKKIQKRMSSISTGFGLASLLIFIGYIAVIVGAVRFGLVAKDLFESYKALPLGATPTIPEILTSLLPLISETNLTEILSALFLAVALLWFGYVLKTLSIIAETQLIDLHSD